MRLIQEFKEFAMKGNVLDMAVGIIIGGAFGTVVKSMVDHVIMPPVGRLMGNVNFNSLLVSLDGKKYNSLAQAKDAGAPVIGYGAFLTNVISFVIVAFCVFLLVKAVNVARRALEGAPSPKPEEPLQPSEDILLLREIRDALVKK